MWLNSSVTCLWTHIHTHICFGKHLFLLCYRRNFVPWQWPTLLFWFWWGEEYLLSLWRSLCFLAEVPGVKEILHRICSDSLKYLWSIVWRTGHPLSAFPRDLHREGRVCGVFAEFPETGLVNAPPGAVAQSTGAEWRKKDGTAFSHVSDAILCSWGVTLEFSSSQVV